MKKIFLMLIILSMMAPLRGTIVTVAYDTVNLRTQGGDVGGVTVTRGEVLYVATDPGNPLWFVITKGEYQGLKIWRGCTSSPNGHKCLPKA